MTINELIGMLREDSRYPSHQYQAIKDSIQEMHRIYQNDRQTNDENLRAEYLERYAVAASKAASAVKSYKEEYGKAQITGKGTRHMAVCNALDEFLRTHPAKYQEIGIANAEGLTDLQKLAEVNLKLEKRITGERMNDHDAREFIDGHGRLHRLLADGSDTAFLQNYAENLQILRTLKACCDVVNDEKRQKLKRHADLYEQYFRTRRQLLQLPEKDPNYKEEREFLKKELEDLKMHGVDASKARTTFTKSAAKKRLNLGNLSMGVQALTLKGGYSGMRKTQADTDLKAIGAKVGLRYNCKNRFLFSVSASAGTAKASLGGDLNAVSAVNNLGGTGLGAAGKAHANALKARMKMKIGGPANNVTFGLSAMKSEVNAMATATFGGTNIMDDNKEYDHSESGIALGAKYGYSALSFTGSGSITICGVKFSLINKLDVGAVGVSAGIRATTGKISLNIGLALGLGTSVTVGIDWTGAKNWFKKLFRRKRGDKKELRESAVRENLKEDRIRRKLNSLERLADMQTVDPRELTTAETHMNRYLNEISAKKETASGIYRRLLVTAYKKMYDAKCGTRTQESMEDALASLICTRIIEKQRERGVAKENSYENAIHSSHVPDILDTIKNLNRTVGDRRLWDFSTEELTKKSFSPERIDQITDMILSENPVREERHSSISSNSSSSSGGISVSSGRSSVGSSRSSISSVSSGLSTGSRDTGSKVK